MLKANGNFQSWATSIEPFYYYYFYYFFFKSIRSMTMFSIRLRVFDVSKLCTSGLCLSSLVRFMGWVLIFILFEMPSFKCKLSHYYSLTCRYLDVKPDSTWNHYPPFKGCRYWTSRGVCWAYTVDLSQTSQPDIQPAGRVLITFVMVRKHINIKKALL